VLPAPRKPEDNAAFSTRDSGLRRIRFTENSPEDLALRGSPVRRNALRVEIQRGLDLRVPEQVLHRLRVRAVS
jgi:hypothetical protein